MLPIIFAVFAACFMLERLIPGWKLPDVPTWTIRVLAINFVQLIIVIVAGYTWEKWLSAYSLFHLSATLTNVPGASVLGGMPMSLPRSFFIDGTAGGIRSIFCGRTFIRFNTVRSGLK